jgi:hypothetical protein
VVEVGFKVFSFETVGVVDVSADFLAFGVTCSDEKDGLFSHWGVCL